MLDSYNYHERSPESETGQPPRVSSPGFPASRVHSKSSLPSRRIPLPSAAGSLQAKRLKSPYHIPPRDVRLCNSNGKRADEQMMQQGGGTGYGQWIKAEPEQDRHPSGFVVTSSQGPAIQPSTTASIPRQYLVDGPRSRSPSSSLASSSLRGAMGDVHISRCNESGSKSPPGDGTHPHRSAPYSVPSGVVWTQNNSSANGQAVLPPSGYDNLAHPVSRLPFSTMPSPPTPIAPSHPHSTHAYTHHTDYHSSYPSTSTSYQPSTTSAPSRTPQSSPSFASAPYQAQYPYPQSRSQSELGGPGVLTPASAIDPYPANRASFSTSHPAQSQTAEEEIRALRSRVRELEAINEAARARIQELELESAGTSAASSATGGSGPHVSPTSGVMSSPPRGDAMTPEFAASWKARYDARIKLFCSLNRAGNALCAWHDSRRERRAHPPRMAPPGTLNCGCTYDEALFEESMARHGIGSYHPGENVRMDPALRNPLLRILQERFAYRDGDFERDPRTGGWVEGEGHAIWEARALAGAASHRKHRVADTR